MRRSAHIWTAGQRNKSCNPAVTEDRNNKEPDGDITLERLLDQAGVEEQQEEMEDVGKCSFELNFSLFTLP